MDLDNRLTELSKLIYTARTALHLYEDIGQYATEINNAKFGNFFGTIQGFSLNTAILELSKLYELNDNFDLFSIPGVCQIIEELPLTSSEKRFIADLVKLDISILLNDMKPNIVAYVSELVRGQIKLKGESPEHLSSFGWMREGLEKVLFFRDKHTAHAEVYSGTIYGPSIALMNKLLDWAEEFVTVVSDNFLTIGVVRNTKGDAAQMKCSLIRVLKTMKILI